MPGQVAAANTAAPFITHQTRGKTMTNTIPSQMPQDEQNPPRFATGWLITIMSLVPSILFLLIYGHRGSPVWLYVCMLGGAGLVSASAIGWLANQLKLRRDIGSIVLFILIGVFIGPLLGGVALCGLPFLSLFCLFRKAFRDKTNRKRLK